MNLRSSKTHRELTNEDRRSEANPNASLPSSSPIPSFSLCQMTAESSCQVIFSLAALHRSISATRLPPWKPVNTDRWRSLSCPPAVIQSELLQRRLHSALLLLCGSSFALQISSSSTQTLQYDCQSLIRIKQDGVIDLV